MQEETCSESSCGEMKMNRSSSTQVGWWLEGRSCISESLLKYISKQTTYSNLKMEMGFNCERANTGCFSRHTEEMLLAA